MYLFHVTNNVEGLDWIVLAESESHAIRKAQEFYTDISQDEDDYGVEKVNGQIVSISSSIRVEGSK